MEKYLMSQIMNANAHKIFLMITVNLVKLDALFKNQYGMEEYAYNALDSSTMIKQQNLAKNVMS